MRCFLAVEVPDPVRLELDGLTRRLRPRLPAARFVSTDALHLTLHFFEDLSPSRVDDVRAVGREACAGVPAFHAALGGLGVFPDPSRPRVLWIGVREGADGLVALHAALARGLGNRDLPLENRPYRAHLTLARFREPALSAAAELSLGADVLPPPFLVDHAVLFESVLSQAGAVHTVLERFPLRA